MSSTTSSPQRYGSVAIAVHWLTAIAIFGLLLSGARLEDMADPAAKVSLLRIHVVVGIGVLVLTLFRLGWWLFADRRPSPPATTPRWQAVAAHAVHGLFYLVIFGMAATGIGMIALSGAGTILFGGVSASLPDFRDFLPRAPHGVGATLLWLLIAMHVLAALYHQVVLRDRLLARMGLGR